jgi:hypothetical protein
MDTHVLLKRYLTGIIIAGFLGVYYVAQQNMIIILSYEVKRHESQLKDLLDRNKSLAYNIALSKSPASINDNLNRHGIELYPIRRAQMQAQARRQGTRDHSMWLGASFMNMAKKIFGFIGWDK